jgi:hypothetical protein
MLMKRAIACLLTVLSLTAYSGAAYAAGVVSLPQTGQTTIFFAGDDGDLRNGVKWPSSRFPDNGNGTVTDRLTGLMWMKNGNADYTAGYSLDNMGLKAWSKAFDFVRLLNSGAYKEMNAGYTDWRVPNILELESLINCGASNSTWMNQVGFTGILAQLYVTSTTFASDTASEWGINPICGKDVKIGKTSSHIYVLPVRGVSAGPYKLYETGQTTGFIANDDGALKSGQAVPSPRFTVNSDQTVTDNLTGLAWAPDAGTPDIGCGRFTMTWAAAFTYINCLNAHNYLGHNDWHLPNKVELRSLVNFSKTAPALTAGHPFRNVHLEPATAYWTSTNSYVHYPNEAWSTEFINGTQTRMPKINTFFVWPVRKPVPAAVKETLTIQASGEGTGSVTSSPSGITCGSVCSGSFDQGAAVVLTAVPAYDSVFAGWGSAASGSSTTTTVIMGADKTVTAQFNAKPPQTTTLKLTEQHAGTTYTLTAEALTGGIAEPNLTVNFYSSTDSGATWTLKGSAVTRLTGKANLVAAFAAGSYTVKAVVNGTANSAPISILVQSVKLVSPISGTVTGTPTPVVSWTAYPGATGYTLQTCTLNTFPAASTTSISAAGTSAPLPALVQGQPTYWRVTAKTPTGTSVASGGRLITYQ